MKRTSKRPVHGVLAAFLLAAIAPSHAQAPIKIGIVHPYTGPLALVGVDATDGFVLYLDQIRNRAGGRPLVVVLGDVTWANDDDVDVALCVGLTSSERPEDDHAHWSNTHLRGCGADPSECDVA